MENELIRFVILSIISYLIATPAGIWMVKAITGQDIRVMKNSSGTGGGTNVSRVLEEYGFSRKKAVSLAVAASIIDIIKAATSTILAIFLTPHFLAWAGLIGLLSVLGNILPLIVPKLFFVGGKGVATAGGAMSAFLIITATKFFFAPWLVWATILILGMSILVFKLRGRKLMVLASAMLIAGLLILFGCVSIKEPSLSVFPVCVLLMSVFILLAHRKNIRNLFIEAKVFVPKKSSIKEQTSF
jgi:glycerol-3-phosphate acyltransferase PlsY